MKQTIEDLQADFTKLLTLAQSGHQRVLNHQAHLQKAKDDYQSAVHFELEDMAKRLDLKYRNLILNLQSKIPIAPDSTVENIYDLIFQKKEVSQLIRILQSELGSLLTAGDWQSPTFAHSILPLAGKQVKLIKGNLSDYKRDRHYDAQDYEREFCHAYVDSGLHLPPTALVTSSGMAAFTTIVDHLKIQLKINGPILVGRSCYFENKWILERAFPGQISYFDEFKVDEAVALAEKIKPVAVFIDTLCNTEEIPIVNLEKLLPGLSKALPLSSYLIIDNSGLATACQPLKYLPKILSPHYFVIESLNKYHQFGADRVTGGIIWGSPLYMIPVHTTRMHLGTILPDASVMSLPLPNRKLLDNQLQRFERNATMLAQALEDYLNANPSNLISHVVYPGLKSYKGYSWTREIPFHGSFLTLVFHENQKKATAYLNLIDKIIAEAKKSNVDIVSGTSFGLDVTRIYTTARYAGPLTTPFLRISLGTETELEMKELIKVFIKVIK